MAQGLCLKVICSLPNEALSTKGVPYLRLDGYPLIFRVFQNRDINDDVLILPMGPAPPWGTLLLSPEAVHWALRVHTALGFYSLLCFQHQALVLFCFVQSGTQQNPWSCFVISDHLRHRSYTLFCGNLCANSLPALKSLLTTSNQPFFCLEMFNYYRINGTSEGFMGKQ